MLVPRFPRRAEGRRQQFADPDAITVRELVPRFHQGCLVLELPETGVSDERAHASRVRRELLALPGARQTDRQMHPGKDLEVDHPRFLCRLDALGTEFRDGSEVPGGKRIHQERFHRVPDAPSGAHRPARQRSSRALAVREAGLR